jgi:hypothetical protein
LDFREWGSWKETPILIFLVLRVFDWLNETLPQDYDGLVFCGGTADYLKPWLEKEFKRVDILWQGGVKIPEKLTR